ncbi:arylamine N-acetyltransferase, partial [Bacillus pumilus]|uniref:arylamine N-acetyltransferase n=1 Tax=Bacillus pumilus TaxID=1408 RepID=UPI001642AE98
HHNKRYLIHPPFGLNLPLHPLPFTEESLKPPSIPFPLKQHQTQKPTHLLQLHTRQPPQIPYPFTFQHLTHPTFLQITQHIYQNQPSPFNKTPLPSNLTPTRPLILTHHHLTTHQHQELA